MGGSGVAFVRSPVKASSFQNATEENILGLYLYKFTATGNITF
jgi:hypothetical protein